MGSGTKPGLFVLSHVPKVLPLAATSFPSSWRRLQKHPQRQYLLDQLRRQLAKDLGLSAQEDLLTAENLPATLEAHLARRAQQNQQDLRQLCYRIDLAEEKVQQAGDFEALAWLILEREAQKVLLREQMAGRL